MKNLLTSIICIVSSFLITFFALKNFYKKSNDLTDNKTEVSSNNDSNINELDNFTTNFETWNEYSSENIDLSADFTAINTNGDEIEKKEFLEKLITGNYAPFKFNDGEYILQLKSLNKNTEVGQKISSSIKSSAKEVYNSFLKENTPFPDFDFTDLNGNNYTNNNTTGKTLGIICWFVQCTSCVEEFPKLNDLYDRNEDNENLVFFSLVFDNEDKVKKMLIKKEFRYPVIANQKKFIQNKLETTKYPIYLIVDKYGDIKKTFDNADAWILALDEETSDPISIEDEIM